MQLSRNIIFISKYYLPHIGGIERHIQQIRNNLLQNGYKVRIFCQYTEGQSDKDVHHFKITSENKLIYKIKVYLFVFRNLKFLLKADIIHIHDVYYWILPFLPILLFKKIFITYHGYEGSTEPSRKAIFWHKFSSVLTNGNICIGFFHKKWYHIKPNFISYGATEKIPINNLKRKGIIFIGRLHNDNGILDYIDSIRKLKDTLVIYGDGPLHNLVDKNSFRILYKGQDLNASKYISYFRYAFCSRYLTILEALIQKTPIISHYNNNIKFDYLHDTPFAPFIFIVHTSDEIAAAVEYIDRHPQEVNQRVEAGYNWAKQQTWSKVASLYEQLWQTE